MHLEKDVREVLTRYGYDIRDSAQCEHGGYPVEGYKA